MKTKCINSQLSKTQEKNNKTNLMKVKTKKINKDKVGNFNELGNEDTASF